MRRWQRRRRWKNAKMSLLCFQMIFTKNVLGQRVFCETACSARRQSHKLQTRKLAICETDPSTWIMERSRLLLKRSQSGNGQEHMYEQWKKNLKSERCDRNSLYCLYTRLSFCCFVPFYILFHFINWLHFWHWEKAANRERERKSRIPKRTNQTLWHRSARHFFHFLLHICMKQEKATNILVRLKLNW